MATQTPSVIPELHHKFLASLDAQLKAAREDKTVPADPAAREALLAGFRERLGSLQEQKKRALARFDEEIQHLQSTLASLEKGSQDGPKAAAEAEKKPRKAAGKKKRGG